MMLKLTDYSGKDFTIEESKIKSYTPYPDGCVLETSEGNFRVLNRMTDPNIIDIDQHTQVRYSSIYKLNKNGTRN